MAPDPPRAPLAPPVFETIAAYAATLDDVGFWRPYVAEVLQRHALSGALPVVGRVGSFPTFLAGRYVVKLFGQWLEGAICYRSELAVLRQFHEHPSIPAPRLVAAGALFRTPPAGWPWPYLVMTRIPGTCWWDAGLEPTERERVARQLGAAIHDLHALPAPADPFWTRDWLAEWRATCVERHRRWQLLPAHLVDQIDGFLLPPRDEHRLLHADLHDHHIFVENGRLVGIVDWGDAVIADPYFELPALHLHTFNADHRLLAAFLDGYGWPPDPSFARRALSMTLVYPFNVLDRVARTTSLAEVATLDERANRVWDRR